MATVLKNLLTCQPDLVPTEVMAHAFMRLWLSQHRHLHPFVTCLHKQRVDIRQCQAFIRPYCPGRFGLDMRKHETCRLFLWDVRKHPADYNMTYWDTITSRFQHKLNGLRRHPVKKILQKYRWYHICMSKLTASIKECYPSYKAACSSATIRSVKTVRATMETALELLKQLPTTRVIHIIRDPRGVTVSRQGQPSYRGRRSETDLAAEAKMYCMRALYDVHMRQHASQIYPNSFMQLNYDEFASAPMEATADVYDFINKTMPEALALWLEEHTLDSYNRSRAWTKVLDLETSSTIRAQCGALFELIHSEAWNTHLP